MPIFDKSATIAADAPAIAKFIATQLTGTGRVRPIIENTLYVITRDGLGYVFLLRPSPEGVLCRVLGDEQKTVDYAFMEATPKAAMQKLVAAPPAEDLEAMRLIPQFERALLQIANRFDKFQELDAEVIPQPTAPPPIKLVSSAPPAYSSEARETGTNPVYTPKPISEDFAQEQKWVPLPLKEPRKSKSLMDDPVSMGLIVCIGVAVLFFGGFFMAQMIKGRMDDVASAITSNVVPVSLTLESADYSASEVSVKVPAGWIRKSFEGIPACNILYFTCLVAVDYNGGQVAAILGSTNAAASTANLDLGKLETETWAALTKSTSGLKKLKVDYLKIGGVQGIRRYFTSPQAAVLGSNARNYGIQVYFSSASSIYELTVQAADESAFKDRQKEIDALLAGVKVK